MHTKGPFSSILNFSRCRGWDGIGDSKPPPPIIPIPVDGVPINETLAQFPDKAYLVPLSSSLLRVNPQVGELLPVVHSQERIIPYLGDELLLNLLKSVYRSLVPRGPQLTAVVKSRLYETA